jgi:hypothetical protein
MAKADLAARLNIGMQRVSLIGVSKLAGADLYAGCTHKLGQIAMPDQSINGCRILLQAEGESYLYHASMPNMIIACERAVPPTNHP